MSIDLDWGLLDEALTSSALATLQDSFSALTLPSYLGPITVSSFSFGDAGPSLEIWDLRDVAREFSAVDLSDDEQAGPDQFAMNAAKEDDEGEPSPSLSRRTLARTRTPERPSGMHSTGSSSIFRPGLPSAPLFRPRMTTRSPSPSPPPEQEAPTFSPSLQMHLHVKYTGNMSLAMQTELRINYPSQGFMSLPLSLTISDVAFEGTVLVAFEGDRRSIGVSILRPGAEGDAPSTSYVRHPSPDTSATNSPDMPTSPTSSSSPMITKSPSMPLAATHLRSSTSTQPGALLRSATVESEVGGAGAGALGAGANKHVLKNVGKVEKFVLEVLRDSLDRELVWPNFQTVLY